jgi:hypothetical protein
VSTSGIWGARGPKWFGQDHPPARPARSAQAARWEHPLAAAAACYRPCFWLCPAGKRGQSCLSAASVRGGTHGAVQAAWSWSAPWCRGSSHRPGESDPRRIRNLAGASFQALSGGQKQRVLIARALAAEPHVLAIAFAIRAMGVLRVFAWLIVPPMTARLLAQWIRSMFILSALFGVLSVPLGSPSPSVSTYPLDRLSLQPPLPCSSWCRLVKACGTLPVMRALPGPGLALPLCPAVGCMASVRGGVRCQ